MTSQKAQYSFMYSLRLLNKQYTNHIYVENNEHAKEKILGIIGMLQKYKISRSILINNQEEKIIVWKTCDFADQDRISTINSEASLNKELKSLGYEIEHNYRIFMIRNYNVCITTYHNLKDVFEYSATMILLKPRMLNQDGMIFMSKSNINSYYGISYQDKEFVDMLKENYQSIALVDNINMYFCFKNKKLVKQYIVIDEFIENKSIDTLINFMKNLNPRTEEKTYCMYELTYLVTTYSEEEIESKIGTEKWHELSLLCNFKIDEKFISISMHNVCRN